MIPQLFAFVNDFLKIFQKRRFCYIFAYFDDKIAQKAMDKQSDGQKLGNSVRLMKIGLYVILLREADRNREPVFLQFGLCAVDTSVSEGFKEEVHHPKMRKGDVSRDILRNIFRVHLPALHAQPNRSGSRHAENIASVHQWLIGRFDLKIGLCHAGVVEDMDPVTGLELSVFGN